ncbi:MAG: AraC family transcriptional regulator [Planctomycetota bacterium]
MSSIPNVFDHNTAKVRADTCEPLKAAAQRGDIVLHAYGRRGYPGKSLRGRTLAGVRSLGTWNAKKAQNWGLSWHHNDGLELTWLQRGSAMFSTKDQSGDLKPGDLTITCPWQAHRLGSPHIMPSRLTWIILDIGVRRPNQEWRWPKWVVLETRDLKRLSEVLCHSTRSVWKSCNHLDAKFQQINQLLTSEANSQSWSRYKIAINDLLLSTLETIESHRANHVTTHSRAEYTVDLFLRSLPNHLAVSWTCESMAKQCGLSSNRFGQICRTLTNQPPIQYLNRVRIDATKKALIDNFERSITQIALAHGFSSSQYFATVFRQQTGSTPSAFRNKSSRSRKTGSP